MRGHLRLSFYKQNESGTSVGIHGVKNKIQRLFRLKPTHLHFYMNFLPIFPIFIFFFLKKRSVLVLYCVLCWQKKAFFYISEKIPERKKVLSRHFSHDPLFPRAQTLTQLSPQKIIFIDQIFFHFHLLLAFRSKERDDKRESTATTSVQ